MDSANTSYNKIKMTFYWWERRVRISGKLCNFSQNEEYVTSQKPRDTLSMVTGFFLSFKEQYVCKYFVYKCNSKLRYCLQYPYWFIHYLFRSLFSSWRLLKHQENNILRKTLLLLMDWIAKSFYGMGPIFYLRITFHIKKRLWKKW